MSIIEVSNLRKRYGDVTAVRDVSFSVAPGEIFGVLGPNGAGKTTTVECVVGLRVPDGGTVSVLGMDPRHDRAGVRRSVGVQLQQSAFPDRLRVGEALELYASYYPDPADPRALLDQLGLTDKRKTPYGKLSGGQKQRLSIALALIGNPRVAVLDELTTGLDPQARRDTWALVEQVRESGVTVVLVTHFMDEAERLCDRIAVIDDGRVVALDTPAGLVERADARHEIRFRPSGPLDDHILLALPEVEHVQRHGPQVVVTGTSDVMQAVTSALAQHHILARDLRIKHAGLDDAFVALTGRHPNPEEKH